MRRFFATLALTAIIVVAGAGKSQANNLLVNGSFENGSFVDNHHPGDDAMSLNPGATNITGWTTTNAELTWIGTPNPFGIVASDGNFSLDLTGYHDAPPLGGISQTIGTVAGATYTLTFDLGNYGGFNSTVLVTAGDQVNDLVSATPVGNPNTSAWVTETVMFQAQGATTTISIVGNSTSSGIYLALDNVGVSGQDPNAVPEPSTFALLGLGGIGLVVGAIRRRRAAV